MVSVVTTSPARPPFAGSPMRPRRGAFTLIELMVAVSLLVVIILAVGIVFKSTGNAVGLGEATGEMFAKVRAINQQIVSDVHGMDRNGFLVIRCYLDSTNPDRPRRFDQISFISTGKFPNRTGAYTTGSPNSVFIAPSVSSAARVWYGQLVVIKDSSAVAEDAAVTYDTPPNSPVPNTDTGYEAGFILGRQAMLMLNPPTAGSAYPSGYASISQFSPPNSVSPTPFIGGSIATAPTDGAGNGSVDKDVSTSITSSRVAVAYTTVPQEMQPINAGSVLGTALAKAYCYRLKTLPSPSATGVLDSTGTVPYLPNGVLRMHPVFAQGVPSFAVDWTDGSLDGNGLLVWHGYNTGTTGLYADTGPTSGAGSLVASTPVLSAIDGPPFVAGSTPATNDAYTAVFTPANAALWPKALRFTYRITDSNDRLNGGRSFVCVVDLPQPTH